MLQENTLTLRPWHLCRCRFALEDPPPLHHLPSPCPPPEWLICTQPSPGSCLDLANREPWQELKRGREEKEVQWPFEYSISSIPTRSLELAVSLNSRSLLLTGGPFSVTLPLSSLQTQEVNGLSATKLWKRNPQTDRLSNMSQPQEELGSLPGTHSS